MANLVGVEPTERGDAVDDGLVLAVKGAALLQNAIHDLAQVVDEVLLALPLHEPATQIAQPPARLVGLDMVAETGLERNDHESAHPPHAGRQPGEPLALGQHAELVTREVIDRQVRARTLEDEEDAMRRLHRGEQLLPRLRNRVEIARLATIHATRDELGEEQKLTVERQDGIRGDEPPVRNERTETAVFRLKEIDHEETPDEGDDAARSESARTSRTYAP